MRYVPQLYARAFVEVAAPDLTPKEETILVKNFLSLIVKNGDGYHLKEILAETEKLLRVKTGRRKIVIESARPLRQSPHTLLKHFLRPSDLTYEKIDPELIAGIKVTINDEEQLDGSLARKLKKLFS